MQSATLFLFRFCLQIVQFRMNICKVENNQAFPVLFNVQLMVLP